MTSKKAALFSCAALIALSLGSAAWAAPRNFDVPAQDAVKAIPEFGRQASIQVVAPADRLKGIRTPAVRGAMEVRDALERLIEGTGLTVASDDGRVIVLKMAQAAEAPSGSEGPAQKADETPRGEDRKVERVVVTGTNIRGRRPKSSPLDTYTKEDIGRSGATTTEQFIQKLPQNLGTRNGYAAGTGNTTSTANRGSVNGVDLRGLGIGTTLVLLNGRRIGLSDFGQTADVSLIPVAAIERVEVLTDGASAIYGSNAIGGVVNFILRDDFDGAETSISYGGVTDGTLRQVDFSQVVGTHWMGGHALAAFAYHDVSALERDDRDYAAPAGRGFLTPDDVRHNVFLTLSQDISDRLTLGTDFGFAHREVKNEFTTLFPSFPAFERS